MRMFAIALAVLSTLIAGCERGAAFGSESNGTNNTKVTAGPLSATLVQLTSTTADNKGTPVISADGSTVGFISSEDLVGNGNSDWQLFAVDADGSNLRQVSPGTFSVFAFDVAPDGSTLVFENNSTGEIWKGNGSSAANGLGIYGFPTITPDGGLIVHAYNGSIMVSNIDGTGMKTVLDGLDVGFERVGASSNAEVLVFSSGLPLVGANDDDCLDVYLVNNTGTAEQNRANLVRLTDSAMDFFSPSISADGRTIAAMDTDRLEVVSVMDADGTELWHVNAYLDANSGISQDGTRVPVVSGGDIYVMNVAEGNVQQVTPEVGYEPRGFEPSISADANRIAFVSKVDFTGGNSDNSLEVFVASF